MINADFNTSLKMISEEVPVESLLFILIERDKVEIKIIGSDGQLIESSDKKLRSVDQINQLLQCARIKKYASQT